MKLSLALIGWCPLACTSFSTHLTATPIEPGATEIGASVTGLVVERGAARSLLPQAELSVRHGIADGFDMGVELSALGFELNTRHRLFAGRSLVLSLVPSAGFEVTPLTSADSDLWMIRLGSTLLLDWHLTQGTTAVFGLKPLVLLGPRPPVWSDGPAGVRVILAPGAMLGLRLPIAGAWAVFPELNLHLPWDVAERRVRTPVVQGGLGLDFRFGD
ncbi:MAG: hypothetical protein IT384_08965 [Deltaproteobacteria bacterium]|nr:hypothetical protein [Deltaproteobacteria bacterium]